MIRPLFYKKNSKIIYLSPYFVKRPLFPIFIKENPARGFLIKRKSTLYMRNGNSLIKKISHGEK